MSCSITKPRREVETRKVVIGGSEVSAGKNVVSIEPKVTPQAWMALRIGREQIRGRKLLEEAKRVPERLRVVILLATGERMQVTTPDAEAEILLLNLIH